jgi:acyl-CoA thioester hydrolase
MSAAATQPTIDYGHVELLPVHFDDLDSMGMVHNSRYALLIERALATFWRHHGHTFRGGRPTTPDAFNVVKEFSIGYRAPIRGTGDVCVHFWLEHMGRSCGVYNFRLLSRRHDRLRRGSPGRDQARPADAAPIAVDT